ncbi:MAG: hypothetical protein U5K74_08800 [Gemmatimonadaceae bacterium]|nr:hypothetical protein [Gemmatimonadaceae bacterium]
MLFDRSTRLRMEFTGPKAAESLTGLVTNDVLSLRGGDGLYACALTAKGRIISDVRILAVTGDDGAVSSLLVDANEAGGVGFAAMIRKYVNPRLARYVDVTSATGCLTLVGTQSLDLLTRLGAADASVAEVSSGPAFTHRAIIIGEIPVRLVRVPDLGPTDAFDMHCPAAFTPILVDALTAAGALPGDASEWHRRRTVGGRPEWGVDMDEGTLAQEANMDALQAISYRKGCYTGQETVARVHFRGHVNRTLRRVHFPDGIVPPHGTPLVNAELATVGDSRSTARDDSDHLIGLAMLRREVPDAGALSWSGDDGVAHAVVVIGAAEEG